MLNYSQASSHPFTLWLSRPMQNTLYTNRFILSREEITHR